MRGIPTTAHESSRGREVRKAAPTVVDHSPNDGDASGDCATGPASVGGAKRTKTRAPAPAWTTARSGSGQAIVGGSGMLDGSSSSTAVDTVSSRNGADGPLRQRLAATRDDAAGDGTARPDPVVAQPTPAATSSCRS